MTLKPSDPVGSLREETLHLGPRLSESRDFRRETCRILRPEQRKRRLSSHRAPARSPQVLPIALLSLSCAATGPLTFIGASSEAWTNQNPLRVSSPTLLPTETAGWRLVPSRHPNDSAGRAPRGLGIGCCVRALSEPDWSSGGRKRTASGAAGAWRGRCGARAAARLLGRCCWRSC